MKFTKRKIVYIHGGSYSYSPYYPHKIFDEFEGDLEEKKNVLIFSDDFYHTKDVDKYTIGSEIVLEIFSTKYFMSNFSYIRSFQFFYFPLKKDKKTGEYYRKNLLEHLNLNEKQWRNLWELYKEDQYISIIAKALLKVKNFRSEFRKSIRNQLLDWLDEKGKFHYPTPFSEKQIGALDRKGYYRMEYQMYAKASY